MVKPGFLTTIQDLGRNGYLRYGVPISGAVDQTSCIVANRLVGNEPNDACLETTIVGPELEFLNENRIAITGGECHPTVNERKVQMWQTLAVSRGDLLSFGKMTGGCRAYIALRGGIDVPLVLGSRSTYVRGSFGGIDGRPLRSGDRISGFDSTHADLCLKLPETLRPHIQTHVEAHAMLGPQAYMFEKEALNIFFSEKYTVTSESDRMGYRLEGSQISRQSNTDIVSDALLPGSVQVPRNGKPILVMQDAQTTGGYPKIGVVIGSDLSLLGQSRPGSTISFIETSIEEALKRQKEYSEILERLDEAILRTDNKNNN